MKTSNIVSLEFVRFIGTLPCIACGKTPCKSFYKLQISFDGIDAQSHLPLCKNHRVEIIKTGIVKMMSGYPGLRVWIDYLEETVRREEAKYGGYDERTDFPAY